MKSKPNVLNPLVGGQCWSNGWWTMARPTPSPLRRSMWSGRRSSVVTSMLRSLFWNHMCWPDRCDFWACFYCIHGDGDHCSHHWCRIFYPIDTTHSIYPFRFCRVYHCHQTLSTCYHKVTLLQLEQTYGTSPAAMEFIQELTKGNWAQWSTFTQVREHTGNMSDFVGLDLVTDHPHQHSDFHNTVTLIIIIIIIIIGNNVEQSDILSCHFLA